MLLYIRVFILGYKLDKLRKDNRDNIVIGLCLELKFLQSLFDRDFDYLISFIDSNIDFFNNLDVLCIKQSINNFNNLFINFTDLIYKDFDKNETYCLYHKDFY